MLKKTITFTDYDGNERTEDYYFNLSKTESLELDFEYPGGLGVYMDYILKAQRHGEIFKLFKSIVMKAYGEKSLDGRRFIKNPEVTAAFVETEAFDKLLMDLMEHPETANEFMKGILPKLD